jgi:succinyl-CoA synthetase alpha subunit
MAALETPTIRTVAVIAEGVPERQARIMAAKAQLLHKVIIGPATVGGLAAGAFKIATPAAHPTTSSRRSCTARAAWATWAKAAA